MKKKILSTIIVSVISSPVFSQSIDDLVTDIEYQSDKNRMAISKNKSNTESATNIAKGAMHQANSNSGKIFKIKRELNDIEFTSERAVRIASQNRNDMGRIGSMIDESNVDTSKVEKKALDNSKSIDRQTARIDAHQEQISKVSNLSVYNTNSVNKAQDSADINKANIAKNRNDIAELRQDFERMSKEYAGGIAGVAAMANVPHTYGNGDLSLGAGVGHFSGESAIAVSVGYRVTESITTQLGVSANTGNDVAPVIGAGVSMSL